MRAKRSSNSLKNALKAPVSSPANPVAQKHGSRELITIEFVSCVLPLFKGSMMEASLMIAYNSKSFERLYLVVQR